MSSSFKQVLVHLDPGTPACRRLTLARELAGQHGAAVCALYATTPLVMALPASPDAAGLAATLLQIDDEQRARTRKMFDETLRTAGPPASWAEAADVRAEWAFVQQAFYADLLVLGQHDPADGIGGVVPADFASQVLVASGRPGMVVPYVGCPPVVGQTVAIAWKPTREAAHAVTAALPLLQRAARVHVLSWDEEDTSGVQGSRLDLDRYLRLHGVQATWHRGGPEPERLGDILLSRVADLGADLLVMGCYGHGRAREWVLGGVSRTILASMTVPVLMAH